MPKTTPNPSCVNSGYVIEHSWWTNVLGKNKEEWKIRKAIERDYIVNSLIFYRKKDAETYCKRNNIKLKKEAEA